jgi:hypothetical protein
VNDELERIYKKAFVAYFRILSQHLSGGTEDNHKQPQSGHTVSRPRFEPGIAEYEAGVLTSQVRIGKAGELVKERGNSVGGRANSEI